VDGGSQHFPGLGLPYPAAVLDPDTFTKARL
jgi:hypothetical protein